MSKSKIICHRGKTDIFSIGNSENSFLNSLKYGFGIETDIRDFGGKLYIAHDIPKKEPLMEFERFLKIVKENNIKGTLALNIKSSCCVPLICNIRNELDSLDYFFFDMAIPDHIQFSKKGLVNAVRVSELETYKESNQQIFKNQWLWIDTLNFNYGREFFRNIESNLEKGLKICIVSPELHGLETSDFVKNFKKLFIENKNLYVCTDIPKTYNDLLNIG